MATTAATGTETTATTATATARTNSLVFAFVTLLGAAPILLVRYLPFTDLPEHVAAIATLARILPGGGGSADYALSLHESQYILYDLIGAVLTRIAGDANLANRLLLFAVLVAWSYATRALLRALNRDERLALFAGTVIWNRALMIGFLPFIASVPIAIFALATLVRQLAEPTTKRAVGLALLSLVLFYTHVSSYVLFGFAGGVMALLRGRKTWKHSLLPLLPSVLAAFVWWRTGSLESNKETATVTRLSVGAALDAAPVWAFDIWKSHGDEVCSGLWWIAFGLVMLGDWKRLPTKKDFLEGAFAAVPLVCTLVMYLATPFHVGAAAYLDVRLAPLLALFAILLLRPASRPALALAAVTALASGANAFVEMKRAEREMVGDADKLLDAMRPNTRVVLLNFEQRSPRTYFFPYVFLGSYHRLKEGAVASYSFTEMAHWPLHYASAKTAPPKHHALWAYRPCDYRYVADGEYYDYALVQGRLDPFANDHPGPDFVPTVSSGAFTLYEKRPDSVINDDSDRGVCE